MIKALLLVVAAVLLPLQASWLDQLDVARQKAAKEGKDIYLVFTSLQNSGACNQYQKRVMSNPDFQKSLEDRFVLAHLDVSKKDPEEPSPELIAARGFGIKSFPTGLFLNSKGRRYDLESGALVAQPDQAAARIIQVADAEKSRHQAITNAAKLEGLDQARAIVAVLKSLPLTVDREIYQKSFERLAALDPEDELDFQEKDRLQLAHRTLEQDLATRFASGKYEEIKTSVDQFLSKFNPNKKLRQRMLFRKLVALRHLKQDDQAGKTADEIIRIDPNSSHGKLAKQIRNSINE